MSLILNLKNNPDRELAILYKQHRVEAMSWIKAQFGLQEVDCEEIFQSSLVILYDNVVTGKLSELTSSVKTYLFSIIKNKVIQHNRQINKISGFDPQDVLLNVVAEDYEEQDEAELYKLRENLLKLGDPCKSILELFYYQNKNMTEITDLLSYKNIDTTKNQKYKCLKRLQNIFFE